MRSILFLLMVLCFASLSCCGRDSTAPVQSGDVYNFTSYSLGVPTLEVPTREVRPGLVVEEPQGTGSVTASQSSRRPGF